MLRALTIDGSVEVFLCERCQVPSDWLDWEVDRHDFRVFDHFNISCILFEELIHCVFCPSTSKRLNFWESNSKLVDKNINIEAFDDLIF